VSHQRGTALAEFALAWPVLLLAVLGAVELSIWSAEAFAARSAAVSGARAGAVAGGSAAVAQQVAISALRPSLAGARLTGWCPRGKGRPPAGVWVCGSDLGGAIEVRVGGSVPALVPLVPGGAGLPLRADVAIPKATFG
jgi:Flp pilus assembly protein TadG